MDVIGEIARNVKERDARDEKEEEEESDDQDNDGNKEEEEEEEEIEGNEDIDEREVVRPLVCKHGQDREVNNIVVFEIIKAKCLKVRRITLNRRRTNRWPN